MPFRRLAQVLQDIRRKAIVSGTVPMTDAQLVEVFVVNGDEAGFEALVRRYGPMVFGVCRRILRQTQDAEDAFQATFLVLVRKAASLRRREAVGNWLFGVAVRTAMQARSRAARRRHKEAEVQAMPPEPSSAETAARLELHDQLDQELCRLPDKYRACVVLCDLMGRTKRQAAEELRCPEGTVSSRLARGRELLRKRLGHIDSAPGVVGGAGLFCGPMLETVPAPLMSATVKVALLVVRGTIAAAGGLPAGVAAIYQGVMKSMLLSKLKLALAICCGLAVVSVAASWAALGWGNGESRSPATPVMAKGIALAEAGPAAQAVKKEPEARQTPEPLPKKDQMRFKGKDFNAWKEVLLAELDPASQIEAIKAMSTFGINGMGDAATSAMLALLTRRDAQGRFEEGDVAVTDAAMTAFVRISGGVYPTLATQMENKVINNRRWAVWTLNSMMARFATTFPGLPGMEDHKMAMNRQFGFPDLPSFPEDHLSLPLDSIYGLYADQKFGTPSKLDDEKTFGTPGKSVVPRNFVRWGQLRFFDQEEALREKSFPNLVKALADSDRLVRNWALQAIMLGRSLAWQVSTCIRRCRKTNDGSHACWTAEGRRLVNCAAAAKALGWLGADAKSAVPALITALDDKMPHPKASATLALGRIGPAAKDAVPALIKVMQSGPIAHEAAMSSLGEIGPAAKEALPILLDLYVNEPEGALVVVKINPAAKEPIPVLVKALEAKGNPELLLRVVIALGKLGSAAAQAEPALMKLYRESEDQQLRNAADEAADKIRGYSIPK